jgi:hypothetical protein
MPENSADGAPRAGRVGAQPKRKFPEGRDPAAFRLGNFGNRQLRSGNLVLVSDVWPIGQQQQGRLPCLPEVTALRGCRGRVNVYPLPRALGR